MSDPGGHEDLLRDRSAMANTIAEYGKGEGVRSQRQFQSARLIEVLEVVVAEGDGRDTVYRHITYYLAKDGRLLARNDPHVGHERDGG